MTCRYLNGDYFIRNPSAVFQKNRNEIDLDSSDHIVILFSVQGVESRL